jgi:hypothetical protein
MMSISNTTPLDVVKFKTFFDQDDRLVKEHEFRRAVFEGEHNNNNNNNSYFY